MDSLVFFNKFSIFKPYTNNQSLGIFDLGSRFSSEWFDLGFWQTSKQFDRKLQYCNKLFRKFQDLPDFPRKTVLCSSIKFRFSSFIPIFNHLQNFICALARFSNGFIGNSSIRRRFFRCFKISVPFLEKWFIIHWPNLAFLSLVPISNHSLGFWKTSKKIYWKQQYRDKLFVRCQGFPRFSWTNFGIFQHCCNIQWLRIFNLGFWQGSKKSLKETVTLRNFLRKF